MCVEYSLLSERLPVSSSHSDYILTMTTITILPFFCHVAEPDYQHHYRSSAHKPVQKAANGACAFLSLLIRPYHCGSHRLYSFPHQYARFHHCFPVEIQSSLLNYLLMPSHKVHLQPTEHIPIIQRNHNPNL